MSDTSLISTKDAGILEDAGLKIKMRPKRPMGHPKAIGTPNKITTPQTVRALRFDNPTIVTNIANQLIMHGNDVEWMIADLFPSISPTSIVYSNLVDRINHDPRLQEELYRQMSISGTDPKSREEYVRTLWGWFKGSDDERALTAARLLGRGFISEAKDQDKPVELPLGVAMAKGIRNMGLDQSEEEVVQ